MTQVMSPSDEHIKDFTRHVDVKFRIDDDVFYGVVGIPVLHLIKFGAMYAGLSEKAAMENPDTFTEMFRLALDEESANKFIERMGDKNKPITMEQTMDIIPWIMGEYGMR